MTHEEFWDLYDSNQITVKIFDGDLDGEHKSVEAFELGAIITVCPEKVATSRSLKGEQT